MTAEATVNDKAIAHAVKVGKDMARLLASVPDIELRLAIIGNLGELCGIVDLLS